MGHDKITATDFAEFLLRFANLKDQVFFSCQILACGLNGSFWRLFSTFQILKYKCKWHFDPLIFKDLHQYLNRLQRLKNETSIRFTFDDLEKMNSLINNLNDFKIIAR